MLGDVGVVCDDGLGRDGGHAARGRALVVDGAAIGAAIGAPVAPEAARVLAPGAVVVRRDVRLAAHGRRRHLGDHQQALLGLHKAAGRWRLSV